MAGRVAVVHAIHRGGAKTRCMDVHPSLPWVAFSDEHDCVVLFDWQCGRVLQEIGSGSGSLEESRLQVVPSWPRYLELSVLLKLSRINVKSRVSRTSCDVLRCCSMQWDNTGAMEQAACSPALLGRRWLAMCCDAKLALVDLKCMHITDIGKSVLDSKSPLCVEFLFPGAVPTIGNGPHAAVGCSDGVIRILSMTTLEVIGFWQLTAALTDAHSLQYVPWCR
eukprot:1185581-Prorocentrum_minimum.AAC.2